MRGGFAKIGDFNLSHTPRGYRRELRQFTEIVTLEVPSLTQTASDSGSCLSRKFVDCLYYLQATTRC